MNNLNSILLEGNLVRDVELKVFSSGSKVCEFSVATNRFFKKDSGLEKEVSFFQVEAWGMLAESCEAKGKKGRGLRVVGRLKQSRWVGADGKNRSKIYIVAEHVEFRPEFNKQKEEASSGDVEVEDFSEEEDSFIEEDSIEGTVESSQEA